MERLFAEVRNLAKSDRKRLAVPVNNAAQYVTEVSEANWDRVLGHQRQRVRPMQPERGYLNGKRTAWTVRCGDRSVRAGQPCWLDPGSA